jgi:hypothetical protein
MNFCGGPRRVPEAITRIDTVQNGYEERLSRFSDAVALRRPDRVPVISLADLFMTRYAGLSNKEAMYDYRRAADAFKASTIKLGLDMAPPVFGLTPGPVLEIIGSKQMMWPGFDLPDDVSYQFVEREYLLADEYDDFLEDPGDFVWRKLLPRVGSLFEPLSALPYFRLMAGGNAVLQLGMAIGASPDLASTFSRFSVLAAETAKYVAVTSELTAELEAAGYPVVAATATLCPFDWVSDMLRGIRGVMLDMYRCPDKLLAAVHLYTDVTIRSTIRAARDSGNPRVFIPLHRGAGGFMSNDQFAKFYWPSLKEMLLAFVDAGLVPLPFWEGNYTPRLEFLAELPPGKIVGHFDVIDTEKFKTVLGDTMCFWGDVPASLLCTGSPADVRDYVRRLIDRFADSGGLIVDGATGGIPYNARPENVEAMVEAAHDYGVY